MPNIALRSPPLEKGAAVTLPWLFPKLFPYIINQTNFSQPHIPQEHILSEETYLHVQVLLPIDL